MISEQIKNVKKFMEKLLIDCSFDKFLVNEISITTYNTFEIDGHINKNFYTSDEFEQLENPKFSYWSKLKPFCFSIIKGNKTPVRFKIVFALDRDTISHLVSVTNTTITENDVNELFLNIKYENGILTYTTGTSLKIFTLDKSLEKGFDAYISNFISTL